MQKIPRAGGAARRYEVVVAERGVLMTVSINGQIRLGHDELVTLTRQLWTRVTNYKPPN